MNNYLYIIGAGGHLRSFLTLVNSEYYNIGGIFDDCFNIEFPQEVCNIKIIGNPEMIKNESKVTLAIGNNTKRSFFFKKFYHLLLKDNLVHKTSKIENNVNLGESNQLFGLSFINQYCIIGDNNIINTGAIVEHETIIGSNNHISVGSILCGRVKIGNNCFIGAGSVIIDRIKITNNVIIGANSLVIKDILEPGTYVGNPVKKIT